MNRKLLTRLLRETRGIAAIEYGILAMVIAVALVGSFTTIGGDVGDQYENVGTEYEQANAV